MKPPKYRVVPRRHKRRGGCDAVQLERSVVYELYSPLMHSFLRHVTCRKRGAASVFPKVTVVDLQKSMGIKQVTLSN